MVGAGTLHAPHERIQQRTVNVPPDSEFTHRAVDAPDDVHVPLEFELPREEDVEHGGNVSDPS